MINVREIAILFILTITGWLVGDSIYTLLYPDVMLERMMADMIHIIMPMLIEIYIFIFSFMRTIC